MMGRTLKATWDELFLCVAASLLWWAGLLLIVTAAPATLGLNNVANRLANYRRSGVEFFWSAARGGFARAWLLFGAMLLTFLMILVNIWFYANTTGWLRIVTVLWLWVLLFFFMVGQYLFPLLCQQVEPNIGLALRNGALLAVRSPLYSALSAFFQLILVIASVFLVLPVLFLLPGMLALSANFALTGLLQEMGLAPSPPEISGT